MNFDIIYYFSYKTIYGGHIKYKRAKYLLVFMTINFSTIILNLTLPSILSIHTNILIFALLYIFFIVFPSAIVYLNYSNEELQKYIIEKFDQKFKTNRKFIQMYGVIAITICIVLVPTSLIIGYKFRW